MLVLADVQKAAGKTIDDYCRETRQTKEQVRLSMQNLLQYSAYAKQQASDAELKKYFQENIEFFQKVTVRVSHIVIRIPENAPVAEKQAARTKLNDLKQQIVAGKVTFADAARDHSQCPSAPKGGDIGFITRKWMVDDAVARTAFGMKKDAISEIVTSEFGFHLLQVTDRTPAKPIEFVAAIEDVRDCFIEEMRQKLLNDLRAKAKIDIHID
jgi:peptidyl-prolyl cis-trans isomerase C